MPGQYVGEIRLMAFAVPPRGWAPCNGQLMAIAQNAALFAVLGTAYGGDGMRTFALPNLQGRAAMGAGAGRPVASSGGEEGHALSPSEMGPHTHPMMASGSDADSLGRRRNAPGPTLAPGKAFAPATDAPAAVAIYGKGAPDRAMAAAAVDTTGAGAPHENRQPFLTLNFCIALEGEFASRGSQQ